MLFSFLACIHKDLGLKALLQVFHCYQFYQLFKKYFRNYKSTVSSQNLVFSTKKLKDESYSMIKNNIPWLQSFSFMKKHFLSKKEVDFPLSSLNLIILIGSDDWFNSAKVKSLPFLKEDFISADKNLLHVICHKVKVTLHHLCCFI